MNIGSQLNIGDKRSRITALAFANDYGSVADFWDRSQNALDLGWINTMTMKFNTLILSSKKFDEPAGAAAPEIAGLEQAPFLIRWVGCSEKDALGGQNLANSRKQWNDRRKQFRRSRHRQREHHHQRQWSHWQLPGVPRVAVSPDDSAFGP